jgi:hypothetical protein
MSAATSALIASVRVCPLLGSWPLASPNQTMIRVESVRNPTGSVASWKRAFNWASGVSQPFPAAQVLIAVWTSDRLDVIAWSRWNGNGSEHPKSV